MTPLQSCTLSRGAAGSRCSRLLDLDKNLFGFLQGCSVSPAEGQEESLSTCAGAVLGGGARALQGAQTRAVLTALGAASQFHPEILPCCPEGLGALQGAAGTPVEESRLFFRT